MSVAWRRLAPGARRLLAHPRWLVAYWRDRQGVRARGTDPGRKDAEFSLADHPEALRDEAGAVAAAVGASPDACRSALATVALPEPMAGDATPFWSREVLLRVVACVVGLARPRTVVEVGVERGYSSAVILRSLAEHDTGRLYSIDLPQLWGAGSEPTGSAIPDELRDHWELLVGPSRQRLPELVARLESIDLFLHDGDHSYASQREDLETVWPALRPGGVVIVDDVWSPALFDFARVHGEEPAVIQRADHQDGVGLLRRTDR